MADNQTPQAQVTVSVTPAPAPQAVAPTAPAQPAVATAVENEVKATLGQAASSWLKDFYDTNKWLFYTVLPLAVIIMLVIKFHDILIDLLLGSAKNLNTQALKKDATLAAQANQTKSQA